MSWEYARTIYERRRDRLALLAIILAFALGYLAGEWR
jgi:hypothetical protein